MAATRKKRPAKRPRKQPHRSGCAVWLIPIALGLLILISRSDVREFISRLVKLRTTGRSTDSSRQVHSTPAGNNRHAAESSRAALLQAADRKIRQLISRNLISTDTPDKSDAGSHQPEAVLSLYFVRYDTKRDLFRLERVQRKVHTTSPASTAVKLLLNGPTRAELNRGFRTLIPTGSRLRSVQLEGRRITVDMNSVFISGQKLGREGMILQLYQIINTLCVFPSVTSVRFTINGIRVSAAGGDGIPLNRDFSFNPEPLR